VASPITTKFHSKYMFIIVVKLQCVSSGVIGSFLSVINHGQDLVKDNGHNDQIRELFLGHHLGSNVEHCRLVSVTAQPTCGPPFQRLPQDK